MIFEESIVLSGPFDAVLARVKDAFAAQGFGTITEIDMQATLRAKIGKEMGHYVIVGACNPQLASSALDADPQVGVLLPCNVVVRADGEEVIVEAMDPGLMASISGIEGLRPIADEARLKISAALSSLLPPS